MKYNEERKKTSWKVIGIWTLLFYPIGLFFLWRRETSDKESALNVGNPIIIHGVIGIVLSILCGGSESAMEDNGRIFKLALFILFSSIAAIIFGIVMKKITKQYKKDMFIVESQEDKSIGAIIQAISEQNNISYDEAKSTVEKMIDKGLLRTADIRNVGSAKKETKVVACESCGANNTVIIGKVTGCEFCGSPIE